jgi:hypothetical protein
VQLHNQRTTNRDQTSNSRHGGKPLSRAKTTSPYLNDFDSAGPDFLAAAPELEPFDFFAPPEVDARAIFFLGCSPATVEEGRVLEDAGLASEASAAWGASAGAVTSSEDIEGFLRGQLGGKIG